MSNMSSMSNSGSSSSSSSSPVKKSAQSALNRFKMEVAGELGIPEYDSIDKGNLSSRENGSVGGNMTKKMVAFAEQAMSQGQGSAVNSSAKTQFPRG
ncbi:MAG: small, acid-soluble spore protein, alpha/beta type [Bacillota bacterium]|jgi:hypothetical protein